MRQKGLSQVVLAAVVLMTAALACGPTAKEGWVAITVNSPGSGSKVAVGEEVSIDSTAVGDAGVDRVELSVNGALVCRDTPPSGNPTTFRVVQSWTPDAEGMVTISVVAFDVNGVKSDTATIMLNVVDGDAVVPTSGADPEETSLPPATTEEGCIADSQYVADVTVSDGTVMSQGQAFVKTWRVRNSGTCDWSAGYELVFVSGAQMGGPAAVALPATPAGGETNVSVNLTAPSAYGTQKGTWRMRADDGTMFGVNLSVLITVPAPVTNTPEPPPPTDTPEPPPPTDTPEPTEETLGPDLVISPMTVAPNSCHIGSTAVVTVRAVNVGDEPSGSFKVRWVGPGATCEWSASSLDPGEAHILQCEATMSTVTGKSGMATVAIVDIDDEVDETNEDNNVLPFPVVVVP